MVWYLWKYKLGTILKIKTNQVTSPQKKQIFRFIWRESICWGAENKERLRNSLSPCTFLSKAGKVTHPHDPDEEGGVADEQEADGEVVEQGLWQPGLEEEGAGQLSQCLRPWLKVLRQKHCFGAFVNILYFLKSINIYQYVSKTHKGVWRAWARRFVKENMIFLFWRGAWYEYDMKSMAFPSCRAAPSMCCGSEPDMSVEDVRSHEMSSL